MKGRTSGVLLPIFSLPGDYGIGDFGAGARQFIDFLAASRQHIWQILPMVPPGSGDSPYMSPSAFAGNPLFLDLTDFVRRGSLSQDELNTLTYHHPDRADYAHLHATRTPILRTIWAREQGRDIHEQALFLQEHTLWLPDYALFMALHAHFDYLPLAQWPEDIRKRTPSAMKAYGDLLSQEVDFHVFLQYHFYRQWSALKAYATEKGIAIMGDIPIYVSLDSAEAWSNPHLFQLDQDLLPCAVAGVPPDAFSDLGQHWGNPLYDWDNQKTALYHWWTQRMHHATLLYDMVRIDHFRGLHTYWSIPAGAETALEGHWEQGPGQPFIDHLMTQLPELQVVAEDLGDLDAQALDFIHNSGLPGMSILLYAFDPQGESAYLPHNCPVDGVMYTGTHDTPTFIQWFYDEATQAQRDFATDYLHLRPEEGLGWGAVCGAWISPCSTAIAPLQDILGLGADARVNLPGTTGPQNWSWRVRAEGLNPNVSSKLAHITRTYRRG